MRNHEGGARGEVQRLSLDSKVLKGNLLGDPTERIIDVYVPHGHDGRGLPLLVDIVGFTAGGPAHTNWKNFGENLPERLDRLIANGDMPPVVVALPDCFTKLGGNQYINSAAMGRWDDFLLTECVPFVEKKFGCGGAGKRGLFGKSSGGYGSIAHALLHPDFWAGAACHSGDMAFELCYLPEFPRLLRKLAKHEGSIQKWIEAFYAAPKTKDDNVHDLMTLAMCATYDPDPSEPYGLRLPVTMDTCEVIEDRWANFLKWDPCLMVEKRGPGLKQMKALYIDCGDIDQYNLVYGARRLHHSLDKLGVAHTYQEFADNHSSVDYRMDISLPILAKALSA
ncbi:MAG TPA: alpha/beta hydrolase-fold protein [Rhizomicrobium sp.]|jgi:enterochelin esterase-like enzyme|nr:alpha/beta hydrolase-fold protein [Rhizomicrobium sp.]